MSWDTVIGIAWLLVSVAMIIRGLRYNASDYIFVGVILLLVISVVVWIN